MTDNWREIFAHIDMDAFFAQVEERDNPGLKGKPVIIGGLPGHRGVVSTCNYVARKYGVKSGMPIAEAVRLCPNAEFIRTHGGKYQFVSLQVLEALRNISDSVDMSSIDEAYLDMTHQRKRFSDLEAMGRAIKSAVWEKTRLTCSVGVAPNRYVAKMCTGLRKPDGLTIMTVEEYREVFAPKKVSELNGVGESTEKALNSIGIFTVAQLQKFPVKTLQARFGVYGKYLAEMANGEYDGHTPHPYQSAPEEKSMGHEHTFDVDEGDTEAIFATVLKLSGKVARRLRQGKYECKRITLKIRYNDFSTFTHQITLDHFTNDEGDIYRNALKCYREAYSGGRKLRLIGVRGSILKPTADSYSTFQPDIFQSSLMTKKHCVLRAADTIRDKFGEKALFYCGIAEAR